MKSSKNEKEPGLNYEYYDGLDAYDQHCFLIEKLKAGPDPEIPWMELVDELTEDLILLDDPGSAEELIREFTAVFPEQYKKEYEFTEKKLLTYYLFRGNLGKIEERLQIVRKSPAAGIDLVTIPVLIQLIYHGHYETALNFAMDVWKPIAESKKVIGTAHQPFCSIIYLHALDMAYREIAGGKTVDWGKFTKEMEKYNIAEDPKEFQIIFRSLETSLDTGKVWDLVKRKKHREVNLELNIHFLKYFRDNFDIPFMLSDFWWNMLTPVGLYKSRGTTDYFHLDYELLDNHFAKNFDGIFLSNQIEMFGKCWGLHYPFYYLKQAGLLTEEQYTGMCENIEGIKYFFLKSTFEDLWKTDFVFKWPEVCPVSKSTRQVFHSTFSNDMSTFESGVDAFIEDHFDKLPSRIMEFLAESKPEGLVFPDLEEWIYGLNDFEEDDDIW